MEKKFALLIDADNVSAKYIKPILDELSGYGNVTNKRIYGDWTNTQHAAWKDELLQNSLSPIQQFSYTKGKNATDSAMIIDAMDILYTGSVDGFCIVSSDSDFTRLAGRIRESGLMVIGMGESKTPQPFRKACDVFTVLELLVEESEDFPNEEEDREEKSSANQQVTDKSTLEESIVKIITENQNSGRETELGEIGSRLVKLYPDFDVRSYGYRLLSKLLEEFPRIQIVKRRSALAVVLNENSAGGKEVENFIIDRVKGEGVNGISLGKLGQEVHERYKDFHVRDLGYSQFNRYIRDIRSIKVARAEDQLWATYDNN